MSRIPLFLSGAEDLVAALLSEMASGRENRSTRKMETLKSSVIDPELRVYLPG